MSILMKLMAIYNAVLPYVEAVNWPKVEAAFTEAVVDFDGGNYAQVITDLETALLALVPAAGARAVKDACKR
jgi:hypothetical protein